MLVNARVKNSVCHPMSGEGPTLRPTLPMKMLMAILLLERPLAVSVPKMRAPDAIPASAMGATEAHFAFAVRPFTTERDMAASRFWKAPTMALVALDGAAKAADCYATRQNIDGGGVEYDPIARPFVHMAGAQVASMAALGAEIRGAYLLHRRRHDMAGHAVLAGGALMNGLGVASSIKRRVADW